jgi:hypothetical protein
VACERSLPKVTIHRGFCGYSWLTRLTHHHQNAENMSLPGRRSLTPTPSPTKCDPIYPFAGRAAHGRRPACAEVLRRMVGCQSGMADLDAAVAQCVSVLYSVSRRAFFRLRFRRVPNAMGRSKICAKVALVAFSMAPGV